MPSARRHPRESRRTRQPRNFSVRWFITKERERENASVSRRTNRRTKIGETIYRVTKVAPDRSTLEKYLPTLSAIITDGYRAGAAASGTAPIWYGRRAAPAATVHAARETRTGRATLYSKRRRTSLKMQSQNTIPCITYTPVRPRKRYRKR